MINNYKIEESEYKEDPFPYIVKDNFLSKSLIDEVNANWPEDEYFYDEITGIRLVDLMYSAKPKIITIIMHVLSGNISYLKKRKFLSKSQKKFWVDFIDFEIPKINEAIYRCFEDFLAAKFGITNELPSIEQLNLMQANEKFDGHGVHNHHYHNPNWTFTMLLNIEDDGIKTRGTDIYSLPKNKNLNHIDELTNFSLKNRIVTNPEGILGEKKTVEFKNNRLFAFLDTPISYHGVTHGITHDEKLAGKQSRKIIRLHAKYHRSYVKKLYGFNLRENLKLRSEFTENNNIKAKDDLSNPDHLIHKGIKKELKEIFKL